MICDKWLHIYGNKLGTGVKCEWVDDVRENIKGEWLHDEITRNGNTVYTPNAKCSICDCYVFQESNFCPNCGADMRNSKLQYGDEDTLKEGLMSAT